MNPALQAIERLIAEGIAQGLGDEEIAANLTATAGQAHLELGRLVKDHDLVALLRHRITTPESHWFPVEVGDDKQALKITSSPEGIAFELWAYPNGRPEGADALLRGRLTPEDLLKFLGVVAPWDQPWFDEGYDPTLQPSAGIAVLRAEHKLRKVTDDALLACPSFRDALDNLALWDLVDGHDRRTLYTRWINLHPEMQALPIN